MFIVSVADRPNGRQMAWDFFRKNQEFFKESYDSSFVLGNLIRAVTAGFASEEKAEEVLQHFRKNPIPGAERSVEQAVETIRLNAAWLERDRAPLRDFLVNYDKPLIEEHVNKKG